MGASVTIFLAVLQLQMAFCLPLRTEVRLSLLVGCVFNLMLLETLDCAVELTLHLLSCSLSNCLCFQNSYFSTLFILACSNFSLKVGLVTTNFCRTGVDSQLLLPHSSNPQESSRCCLLMQSTMSSGSLFLTSAVKMKPLMLVKRSAFRTWSSCSSSAASDYYFLRSCCKLEGLACMLGRTLALRCWAYRMQYNKQQGLTIY